MAKCVNIFYIFMIIKSLILIWNWMHSRIYILMSDFTAFFSFVSYCWSLKLYRVLHSAGRNGNEDSEKLSSARFRVFLWNFRPAATFTYLWSSGISLHILSLWARKIKNTTTNTKQEFYRNPTITDSQVFINSVLWSRVVISNPVTYL